MYFQNNFKDLHNIKLIYNHKSKIWVFKKTCDNLTGTDKKKKIKTNKQNVLPMDKV